MPLAETNCDHNVICQNLVIALRSQLSGKARQIFMGSVKLRLRIANEDMFYYPDVIVASDRRDTDEYCVSFPQVLIEVLSPEIEHFDRREKFSSYTQIESLEEYILVAQDQTEVTVFRRATNWRPEVANQPSQQLRIESFGFAVPLSDIYQL
jgi:Uma2 family endonuclease